MRLEEVFDIFKRLFYSLFLLTILMSQTRCTSLIVTGKALMDLHSENSSNHDNRQPVDRSIHIIVGSFQRERSIRFWEHDYTSLKNNDYDYARKALRFKVLEVLSGDFKPSKIDITLWWPCENNLFYKDGIYILFIRQDIHEPKFYETLYNREVFMLKDSLIENVERTCEEPDRIIKRTIYDKNNFIKSITSQGVINE